MMRYMHFSKTFQTIKSNKYTSVSINGWMNEVMRILVALCQFRRLLIIKDRDIPHDKERLNRMDNIEKWLVLFYKMPSDSSTNRVYIWRQIKKLGAIYMQDGGVILPYSKENMVSLRKLNDKIKELNGDPTILISSFYDKEKETAIIEEFNNTRNLEYKELLEQCGHFFAEIEKETEKQNFTSEELEEVEEEYEKLKNWNDKIKKRDFFNASMSEKVNETLLKCQIRLEEFSDSVYETIISRPK